jgi:hypothetical protein
MDCMDCVDCIVIYIYRRGYSNVRFSLFIKCEIKLFISDQIWISELAWWTCTIATYESRSFTTS